MAGTQKSFSAGKTCRARSTFCLVHLFRTLTCVPADAQTGHRAGEYMNRYRKSNALDLGDALIAAAAVLNGAALWTRNRRHYPMKDLSFY